MTAAHKSVGSTCAILRDTCPICSGMVLKTLRCFTAEQAAEHFFPRGRDEERHRQLKENIELLWQQPTCQVMQCERCLFTFPLPYVGGEQEFYELAYGVPSYPHHRWEYDRAIEFLKTLDQFDTPRLLELGAGSGNFIKHLLQGDRSLEPSRIVATDYSSHSVSELRKLGVDARPDSVFELADCTGNTKSFAAVCAFQSIEHMANVTEVISALQRMVRPGGLIILSVPNGTAIDFNEQHLCCFDMPPNHVGRWYRKTFEALADKAGLQLVAHEIEPKRMPQLLRDAVQLHVHGVGMAKPHSFASRVRALKSAGVRRALLAATGAALLLPRLPSLWRLESGNAQLAVLRVRECA